MLKRRYLLMAGAGGLALLAAMRYRISPSQAADERFRGQPYRCRVAQAADARPVCGAAAGAATERPFTSPLDHEQRRGTFACAGCDLDLFSSTTKFDSRTGWPSFWAPLEKAVGTTEDTLVRHGADGGPLQPLRRPSRPRLQRRTEADRPALLHERRRPGLQRRPPPETLGNMILFVLAYLGGVLTIVSPCILPVLPFVFAQGRPAVRHAAACRCWSAWR